MARHRADPHLAVALADIPEFVRERVDVDQVRGGGRGEASSSAAASAAGQQARVGSQPGQQFERLFDARSHAHIQTGPELAMRSFAYQQRRAPPISFDPLLSGTLTLLSWAVNLSQLIA